MASLNFFSLFTQHLFFEVPFFLFFVYFILFVRSLLCPDTHSAVDGQCKRRSLSWGTKRRKNISIQTAYLSCNLNNSLILFEIHFSVDGSANRNNIIIKFRHRFEKVNVEKEWQLSHSFVLSTWCNELWCENVHWNASCINAWWFMICIFSWMDILNVITTRILHPSTPLQNSSTIAVAAFH